MVTAKVVVGVVLYLLGQVPTESNRDLWKPAAKADAPVVAQVKDKIGPAAPWDTAALYPDKSLRSYTFRFEGRATHAGKPVPNASVLVFLTTSQGRQTQGVTSDENGFYSIEVSLEGSRNEPIDWSMTARTPDSQQVELVGRRILMHEEETIMVQNPLELFPG